jgi:hypothetical protein
MTETVVRLDKAIMRDFLDALGNGRPVAAPEGGWGPDALAALSAAAEVLITCDTAAALRPAAGQHPERREALTDSILRLAAATVLFNKTLAMALVTGRGDALFAGAALEVRVRLQGNNVVCDPPLGGAGVE